MGKAVSQVAGLESLAVAAPQDMEINVSPSSSSWMVRRSSGQFIRAALAATRTAKGPSLQTGS